MTKKKTPLASMEPDFGDNAIDIPDIEESTGVDANVIEDENGLAFKYAFIGTGQAGNRLVTTIHSLGYRRTILFNTATQDLEGLDAPEQMIFNLELENVSGAGKDMAKGRQAINAVKEDVMNFFKKRIGDSVDHIMICFGAGGGTGGGTAPTLIALAKQYLSNLGVVDAHKKVGAIMSLPSRAEGPLVNQNAHEVATELCDLAKKGEMSPLLIIDNQKICSLYSSIPIKQFYPYTNKTVVQLFNIFPFMASRSSTYSTFDIEDYKSVLESGLITCGMCKIKEYKEGLDLAKMFRANLQKNLFASNINFETVTHAAAILAADDKSLGKIPQSVIENTFNGLNLLFGNRKGVMLHRGIYEIKQPGLRLFTIIGGFDTPIARLEEIKKLGN